MSVCFHRLAAPGQLVLFAMGGTAYLALEIAWRGTTHWTMFLAGGACLCALDALGRLPLPTPLLAGMVCGLFALICTDVLQMLCLAGQLSGAVFRPGALLMGKELLITAPFLLLTYVPFSRIGKMFRQE